MIKQVTTCCYLFLLLFVLMNIHVEAVFRRASLNSALHLECRYNQTIKINSVKLGKERPQCSQALRSDHSDYMRVVSECSGLQSCSNIVLKESTSIACANGLQDSEYMEVDYICIEGFRVLNMCHNTERTMSVFEGYLASPDYPHLPADSESEHRVVCSCQLIALYTTAHIQLRLVDMYNSNQVKISEAGARSRYLCNDKTNGRCIEEIHQSRLSSLNITYRPRTDQPTRFILQYNAGRRSRVKAICRMTVAIQEVNHTTTTSTVTTQHADSEEIDKLKGRGYVLPVEEILSLEVIVGICAAAVLVLICVIVSVVVCRRKMKGRSSRQNSVFKTFTPDGNPTYDMVPHEHQYATIAGAENGKRLYANADPAMSREYSEPCIQYDQDYNRSAANNSSSGYYSRASDGSGIYESVELLEEDNPQRLSRLSNMKKCGSMPLHPAPPAPCNSSVKAQKQSYKLKSTPPVATPAEIYYDTPSSVQHEQHAASESTMSSTESIPKIDLDLSDLLVETDKLFVHSENTYVQVAKPTETEYMLPVQVHSTDTAECKLLENELYVRDN